MGKWRGIDSKGEWNAAVYVSWNEMIHWRKRQRGFGRERDKEVELKGGAKWSRSQRLDHIKLHSLTLPTRPYGKIILMTNKDDRQALQLVDNNLSSQIAIYWNFARGVTYYSTYLYYLIVCICCMIGLKLTWL